MKMKQLIFGILLSLNLMSYAQNVPNEVLFTIDNKPYYTEEFSRVYNKNLDLVKDESQKDLNQYLDLFIGYKLKINKAYKLGLQEGTNYRTELKTYRTQLAKNYVSDSKVTKELVEEAFKRSLKEIRASHILFLVDENASPEDTLKVYKQIQDVYQRINKGEDFIKMAVQYSQDPSVKENKGDLGYFSAFRMVYPFETAAYNTSKGNLSKIFRTRFGYHFLKVDDIRDNRGELLVEHIMIAKPTSTTDSTEEINKPKNTIQDIHKKIKQGENFESLAKQFSEDKTSSSKGGLLNRFGSGQLSSEKFETIAFSLTKENPISEPFETDFGWHIVKLVEKYPVGILADRQADLETKVAKDDRSRKIAASLTEKLRKKYTVTRDDKFYASLVKLVTNDYYDGKWTTPEEMKEYTKKLFSINNDKEVNGNNFLFYLQSKQKTGSKIKPINKLVDNSYQSYVDSKLNEYYNEKLETEFPDFAATMDEYRDGLLLFDLMEKEIWNKSKTDTLGLKKYYESNINKYSWKNKLDVAITSSTNLEVIKKAYKLLNQGKTPEFVKEKLNIKDGAVNLMTNSGIFEEGSEALPKTLKLQEGISEILKEGDYYFVVKVNKVIPAQPKTLEECKGKVINDYQQYLEENWVSELKKEFKVEVNQNTFEKVKKELKS
ncbi:MAG: peptidylprolyl isomerase [Bacteroidota bacterium]